ncbi:ras-related protein Rab-13-like [Babylonia areolata]|uniref:ras-related protein Rab-13-like n=1 Tax=Babylonia areolata TaxID=304850 RepID=UPI003FCFA356
MPLTKDNCAVSYKVLILGTSGVGKTAILRSLMGREFITNTIPTVGEDFVTKVIEADGALIALNVWDTAGNERFRSIRRQQFRETQGIILVYDITDRESYSNLEYWINSVETGIRHSHNKYEPVPIVLCGNKADMEERRQVTKEDGEMMVKAGKVFGFYETSAKTGDNVFAAFHRLAGLVTEICDPRLMKSYHPCMIKESDDSDQKETASSTKGKKKKKGKRTKAQKGKDCLSKRGLFWCCFRKVK